MLTLCFFIFTNTVGGDKMINGDENGKFIQKN